MRGLSAAGFSKKGKLYANKVHAQLLKQMLKNSAWPQLYWTGVPVFSLKQQHLLQASSTVGGIKAKCCIPLGIWLDGVPMT